jgi:hypothetical protein
MVNTMELSVLLHSLPPELRDEIYDFTFTPDPGVRHVDRTYLPPAQLQVDQASRQQFASRYYGQDSTFQMTRANGSKWLACLSQGQRDLVRKIRVEYDLLPELKLLKNSQKDSGGVQTLVQFMQRRSSAMSTFTAVSATLYIRVYCGEQEQEQWVTCENEIIELHASLATSMLGSDQSHKQCK